MPRLVMLPLPPLPTVQRGKKKKKGEVKSELQRRAFVPFTYGMRGNSGGREKRGKKKKPRHRPTRKNPFSSATDRLGKISLSSAWGKKEKKGGGQGGKDQSASPSLFLLQRKGK